ncbi:HWE histidine kinase domain-containing protein [Sphingomonas sp. PAMC 26605]|uniref:HWE histidine kinase domain-containing protein n=1 Tax=Sphingomonas sp. PAMC 26605 TaxID=1112214 RepID=UPI00026CAC74|nr:HWE histidine kinase domain-containing protein [Sphingomonas sp. PAMC 26605]
MSDNRNLQNDLTECDREPITRLDQIQDFAFLVAMTNDWTIVRVSQNVQSFLQVAPAQLLGSRFDVWISKAALHAIRTRLATLASSGSERLFDLDLVEGVPPLDLAIHFQNDLLIIEGEFSQKAGGFDVAPMTRAMVARLAKAPSIERLHTDAARQVLAVTGFDRVMIYRFDERGDGEVIAESTRAGVESFLGLHYPATDIPQQARALYLLNPFRIIADVAAPPVALLPPIDAVTPPLDLTMAISRSVSPVHLEYLVNMDVAASLSISIVVDGQLWGLIACHAAAPRLPSFAVRTGVELFGAMYSLKLESRLRRRNDEDEQKGRGLADRLITMIAGDESLMHNAMWLQDMTRDIIDCDGIAIYRGGTAYLHGSTPPEQQVAMLAFHMNAASPSRVFVTDCLAAIHPPCATTAERAAGMMSIPISRIPRDYIMLFRRERLERIRWGGNPTKEANVDAGPRISPRKSFAAFVQEIRGRAIGFSEREVRMGEAIRQALIEVILRYSDEAAAERRRAAERQELLIAELNHRVRNILALIRSLITKTGEATPAVASYVEALSGRVQALARAHDRITRQEWGPAPLAGVFEDEVAAHQGTRERLRLIGPQVQLQPRAISTMALVVHELVTNSCKYGALSTAGRIEVTTRVVEGEGVYLEWKEVGGPAVTAPTRRGFGSTILERTVPFDLQGTADLHYRLAGLEAEFFIPQHNVYLPSEIFAPEPSLEPRSAPIHGAAPVADSDQPLRGALVLLLEDNMLIALEAEDMLRALGAKDVLVAATLSDAEHLIASHTFQFAMLDINVGGGTSFELATKLTSRGTPFIFASGYGEGLALERREGSEIVLQKPYERRHLERAIEQVLHPAGV